jgi:site-specific DNA-methyltransferase (adenine-specific)
MINTVLQGDCLELMKQLPDKSVDAVITDPPYGIGVSHWDKAIDIEAFTKEVKRVSRDFYCFFGQMPTVLNWINEANNQGLKYREHITWVKRNTVPCARLSRCFESIFIYGDRTKFYQTRGPYEDVKIPGILFDVATIEGFQRCYSEAQALLAGKTLSTHRDGRRQKEFNRMDGVKQKKERAYDDVNYTNVWSFLPPSYQTGRSQKGIFHHPTEKPVEVMKRLIEMLTPENGIVLDPFAGSFTTAVAAINTNRDYICIEKEAEYVEVGKCRIEEALREKQPTLEERVQWLETQVKAQSAQIKKLQGQQLNLFAL